MFVVKLYECVCVVIVFSIFHPRRPSKLCLTLSLWSPVIKLRLPDSNNCACSLLIVITFLSLLSCTSICKSQLRFVSCGVFTQLNENSDSDSEKSLLRERGKTYT